MKTWKILKPVLTVIGIAVAGMGTAAIINKPKSVYADRPEEQNPFEGQKVRFVPDDKDPVNADGERGHLERLPASQVPATHVSTFYERVIKRGLDVILSFFGIIIASPVFLFLDWRISRPPPVPFFIGQNDIYLIKNESEQLFL